MMKLSMIGPGLVIPLFTIACISDVSVKNVARHPKADGVRAALPQPFILVEPTPTGGIEVSTKHLPDPQATFAFDSWSILGSHTFNVQVSEGLLSSVTWNADASGAATEALKSLAAIEAAKAKAGTEASKAEGAKREEQEDELREAERAVEEARLYIEQLRESGFGEESPEIKAAKVKLAAAEAKFATLSSSGASNDPEALERVDAADDRSERAWGPMLFGIRESYEGDRLVSVELVPTHQQGRFRTIGTPEPPAHDPPRPVSDRPVLMAKTSNGPWNGKLTFTSELKRTELVSFSFIDENQVLQEQSASLVQKLEPTPERRSVLEFQLDSTVGAGDYRIQFVVTYRPPGAVKDLKTDATVRLRLL